VHAVKKIKEGRCGEESKGERNEGEGNEGSRGECTKEECQHAVNLQSVLHKVTADSLVAANRQRLQHRQPEQLWQDPHIAMSRDREAEFCQIRAPKTGRTIYIVHMRCAWNTYEELYTTH
jgi:hypothetical protein